MKNKKVVILDYDGTLYNGSVLDGWADYVEEFLTNYIGKKEAKEFLKRNNFKDFNIVGQSLASALIKEFGTAKVFYDHQDKHNYVLSAPDLKYIDSEKIKRLKNFANVYIVSNSPVNHVVNNSIKNGFDISFIDGIFANQFEPEDVSKTLIFKEIQAKENAEPEDVFVVGDSVKNDIEPAEKLGFNVFFVETIEDLEKVLLEIEKIATC